MAGVIKIEGSQKSLGGKDVFIVAEIGKNFIQTEEERPAEEYLKNAKALIDAAVLAGADAVKFQTHEVEDEQLNVHVVSPHFSARDRYSWVSRNTEATPDNFWQAIKDYCQEKGIIFFSTPMSRMAAEKLNRVGVPLWKVGSGDVQDHVLLDHITATGKPVIISTGMVSLSELEEVVKFFRDRNTPLVILYCISHYPCPPEYFNLATIEYLKEKYPDVVVGFSDHSLGLNAALAAVKLGAKVIEKHFSFDRGLFGADHKVSMTPEELSELVRKIRTGDFQNVDHSVFYGSKDRELEGANNVYRQYFNKILVAARDIPAGTTITKEMVYAMRPKMYAPALLAQHFLKVVGKSARKGLKRYDPIYEHHIEGL